MTALPSWPRGGYQAIPPATTPPPDPGGGDPPSPDEWIGVTLATPVLHGEHPTVAANPHDGHAVTSLMARDGVLLMGYGDWTHNTGPLDLLGLDLTTGEPVTLHTGVRTECIEVWRVIDGDLYVPWIDTRSGYDHLGGGYVTNAGGVWREVVVPDLIHTFDVATSDGHDLLVAGSARSTNRATLRRSLDDGATWVDITPPDVHPGMMRLHSLLAADAAAYVPAWGRWEQGSWDGVTFGGQNAIDARRPVLNGVQYSMGYALDSRAIIPFPWQVTPQATDGQVLYGTRRLVNSEGDAIVYSSPGIVGGALEWTPLLRLPGALLPPAHLTHSQRVEVHDGTLYVGGTQGRVWRVTP